MLHHESIEMVKVFDWIRKQGLSNIIWHTPNEARRSAQQGAMLKRMGLLAGVADIVIARASNGFHGCFIEVKVKPNKLTPAQTKFLFAMKDEGYDVALCYGADETIEHIKSYLNL